MAAIELAAPEGAFSATPPHNTEAEESVLASLLIDPDAMGAVAALLQPADFYHPRNARIYSVMMGLYRRGEPTDFVIVCDELDRLGWMELAGGTGNLARMLTVVPTSLHVLHYAGIVRRTAANRGLITAAGEIARVAYSDPASIAEAFRAAEGALAAVRRRYGGDETTGPRRLPPVYEVYHDHD